MECQEQEYQSSYTLTAVKYYLQTTTDIVTLVFHKSAQSPGTNSNYFYCSKLVIYTWYTSIKKLFTKVYFVYNDSVVISNALATDKLVLRF